MASRAPKRASLVSKDSRTRCAGETMIQSPDSRIAPAQSAETRIAELRRRFSAVAVSYGAAAEKVFDDLADLATTLASELSARQAELEQARFDAKVLGTKWQEKHTLAFNLERELSSERDRREGLERENERLLGLLHRDATGLAAGLANVVKECRGSIWIAEGRGSYEWDDDRYRDETRLFVERVLNVAMTALKESGAVAHEAFHPP